MTRLGVAHTAGDGGTEHDTAEAGRFFVRRDARNVFIKERGHIGEHMMIMRATTVPALPQRRCTAADPFANTGEGPLREHLMTDVSIAHRAKRVHDEFIAENTEIKMVILFFDLGK